MTANAKLIAQMTGLTEQDAEILIGIQLLVSACNILLELTNGGLNDAMPESVWEQVRAISKWAEQADRADDDKWVDPQGSGWRGD